MEKAKNEMLRNIFNKFNKLDNSNKLKEQEEYKLLTHTLKILDWKMSVKQFHKLYDFLHKELWDKGYTLSWERTHGLFMEYHVITIDQHNYNTYLTSIDNKKGERNGNR